MGAEAGIWIVYGGFALLLVAVWVLILIDRRRQHHTR